MNKTNIYTYKLFKKKQKKLWFRMLFQLQTRSNHWITESVGSWISPITEWIMNHGNDAAFLENNEAHFGYVNWIIEKNQTIND